MYLPLVADGVVVKGNQKCCMVPRESTTVKCSVWGKHDLFVISGSSITYMVLYSIYLSCSGSRSLSSSFFFFLKFAEALECLCTQHGALVGLRNEGTRLSKGNPLALITSLYHFIQQRQMCLCFRLTFYCSALWSMLLQVCLKRKNIYIKTLHSSSWLFRVPFVVPLLQNAAPQSQA